MLKMYGIPNCSTVKKARVWLEENNLEYTFHDYKKQGVPADEMDGWLKQLSWEDLVNRKGMTWRNLTDAQRAEVVDAKSAKALMLEFASVIKRPLLVKGKKVLALGFDVLEWEKQLLV